MIDPNVMKMISQMFGGSSGMSNVLSPFSQMAKVANPMAQSQPLAPADEKSFGQLFSDHMGQKKDEAIGRFDKKKEGLMSLFKLFAGGGA